MKSELYFKIWKRRHPLILKFFEMNKNLRVYFTAPDKRGSRTDILVDKFEIKLLYLSYKVTFNIKDS